MLVSSIATFGYPMPVAALALRLPVAAVAAGALLAGAGSAVSQTFSAAVTQQRVPAGSLSRVGAFSLVGAYAFGPVAFVAARQTAGLIGARAVLGFGAAWSVFGALVVLAVPSVRTLTWQPGPDDNTKTGPD